MLIKNTSITELTEALVKVNEKYEGNVKFREIEAKNTAGTRFRLTLQVVDAKGPGHRKGFTHPWTTRSGKPYKAKRLIYACWHVHGDYFDCLFDINPKVEIRVGRQGTIYRNKTDNWEDFDMGSIMYPVKLSELCDCGNENVFEAAQIDKNLRKTNIKSVRQSDLSAECWGVQVWGKEHCKTCEFLSTGDCGGKEIRKTNRNEKGIQIPI
uniref:Uncharacterized protein n=1 Tax=viral metagenome TaxID=1070528 RepID=A0A6M3KX43_9ZZZZ